MKYHWYEVRINYRKVRHGFVEFHYNLQIGLSKQSDILKRRQVLTCDVPVHKRDGVKKSMLSNGILNYDVLCYLGYFAKDE